MKRFVLSCLWLSLAAAVCWPRPAAAKPPAATRPARTRNVTFLSTSDPHYKAFEAKDWNRTDRQTIEEMNRIASVSWPEELGGGKIDPPRGAVVLGDCIDDGDKVRDGKDYTAEQYKAFVADFGFDGTDGLLKYPAFETWGNHDGPPIGKSKHSRFNFQAALKKRNAARKAKGWLTNLADNGLHYSWDYDDVHLVSLGIYPADFQNPKVRYSAVWHDPQGALTFLKNDLAKCVGDSGRPVVLMAHCGFDTDWWHEEDWRAFYEAAKAYNVVLYLYGHTGTGLRRWAPEGEKRKWACINDGQTTSGFFVIQITGDRLRAAYRCKDGQRITKNRDGSFAPTWSGKWRWRFTLDKKIGKFAPPPPRPRGPARVEYRVDPAKVVGTIDVGIHGQFLEHIFNSVHGGLWGDLVRNPSLEAGSGGHWMLDGKTVKTATPVTDRRLVFGDKSWGDYELTLDARKITGAEGFIVLFRVAGRNRLYWANMGGWGNREHAIEKARRPMGPHVAGTIEKGRWYRVRIRCEGARYGIWLDDRKVLDVTDAKDPIIRGAVGLTGWGTQVQFRRIKVATLDGKTLFEGLPPASAMTAAPDYWSFFGEAGFTRITDGAFNSRTSLCISHEADAGEAGLRQGPVMLRQGERYSGSLWARGRAEGRLRVRLVDSQRRTVAQTDLPSVPDAWRKLTFELTPPRTVPEASLEIGLTGGGSVCLDMVTLFSRASAAVGGLRPDVLEAIRRQKPASIRYPGGCFASAYRWKDGIGPREKRTYFPRVIWDDQDPSQFGTDEFLDLCRRVGAEPIIVVNASRGVEEALDWLEYCNGARETKWGAERARNGRPEPHNVRLWEIDNETWGMGAERYAATVVRFSRALRKKDPSLKIIACGGYGYDDGKGSTNRWNQRLLDKAAKDFDYLSIHYYNGIRYEQDHVEDPRRYEAYMRDEIGGMIGKSANPAIRIYCSEWGMMNDRWASGLYAGGLLNAFERLGELVPMACPAVWLQSVSRARPHPRWASCSILFDHKTCYGAPTYVVQKLWRDHFAPRRVRLEGPDHSLNAIATLSRDGKTLYLKAVNPTDRPAAAQVTVAPSFAVESASLLLLAGRAYDRNSLAEPRKLVPSPGRVALAGQVLRFDMPPWSAGVVSVKSK